MGGAGGGVSFAAVHEVSAPAAAKPNTNGVVLALGGGGARGLAHLGAFALLEQHGIPVRAIVGCSSGAMVAAMWLAYGSSEAAVRRWREYLAAGFPISVPGVRLTASNGRRSSLLTRAIAAITDGIAFVKILRRSYVVDPELSRRVMEFLVPAGTIEALRLPLALVATDYRAGETVILDRGDLRELVSASCAMPVMSAPQRYGDRLLIDGGVMAEVPVEQACELFGGPVVAIDTPEDLPDELPDCPSLPKAFIWADTLTHRALRHRQLAGADLVIAPKVAQIHWSEFGRIDEAMQAGHEATAAVLPRLAALVR